MAIDIIDNFNPSTAKPIDKRLVFDTIADRDAYPGQYLYDGLLSFVKSDNQFYLYNNMIWEVFKTSDEDVLLKTNNLSDLINPSTARTNLNVHSKPEVISLIQGSQNAFSVLTIAERDNLTGLKVTDRVFVEDDGDNKWALYLVTSIEEETNNALFTKIADRDVFDNAMTAEAIRDAYESNLNRNAFTDTEKLKLSLITVASVIDLNALNNLAGQAEDLADQADSKAQSAIEEIPSIYNAIGQANTAANQALGLANQADSKAQSAIEEIPLIYDAINGIAPSTASGLEKITEEGKSGYRLIGKNAAYHANIGDESVDLTTGSETFPETGASGGWAFASGRFSQAKGNYSFASGMGAVAEGFYSQALGVNVKALGLGSFVSGAGHQANLNLGNSIAGGDYSFVHQRIDSTVSKEAAGKCSVILGGTDNELTVTAKNSVMLGCKSRSSDLADTTHVENLKTFGSVGFYGSDPVDQGLVTKPISLVASDYAGLSPNETEEADFAKVLDLNDLKGKYNALHDAFLELKELIKNTGLLNE